MTPLILNFGDTDNKQPPSHFGRFISEVKYEAGCVLEPVSKLLLEL